MSFWEFLQKTSIKIGLVEIDGFGANVICLTFAVLLLRFGLKIGPAILRRFTKPKDVAEIRSQILREIEVEKKARNLGKPAATTNSTGNSCANVPG